MHKLLKVIGAAILLLSGYPAYLVLQALHLKDIDKAVQYTPFMLVIIVVGKLLIAFGRRLSEDMEFAED